ncbi:MAG: hypothetical protein JJT94_05175 [Bernardetiaceae bacterium]|nr:hypothetical protein [Bernardetiaceae bacterium]
MAYLLYEVQFLISISFMLLSIFSQSLWVVFASMFKFIVGPLIGVAIGLPVWITVLLTTAGMTISAFIFANFGILIREKLFYRFFSRPRLFSRRTRRMVRIWRSYGIKGTAFLTPLIFSPIIGTLIAVSFGERKDKIITYMAISAFVWAVVFSLLIEYLGKEAFMRLFGVGGFQFVPF